MASTLRAILAESEPVPWPTQSATEPPKHALVRAAATVEFPDSYFAKDQNVRALVDSRCPAIECPQRHSVWVIAGLAVKSLVGLSRSSAITLRLAPFTRQS